MLKKVFFFCLMTILSLACVSQKEMDELRSRMDTLEYNSISSIKQQVLLITSSISDLEDTDAELEHFISELNNSAVELEKAIQLNAEEITSLEDELTDAIESSRLEQLEALKELQESLESKLYDVNLLIADLVEKDTSLDKQINSLKDYTQTELNRITDWIKATFATIEQYNATITEIAAVKADIEIINESILALELKLNESINNAIIDAVDSLQSSIEAKSEELLSVIAQTETGLKYWVNEQLSAYYTIAQIDAKISLIELLISEEDTRIQEEINAIQSQLAAQKTEIIEAYSQAISEAITENNGIIDGKIQSAVSEINDRISNDLDTINEKIDEINDRLNGIEQSISEILDMIQSIVVIPSYSDGSVAISQEQSSIFFEVYPLEAAKRLEAVSFSCFSLKAVKTNQTNASVDFINLPITGVEFVDELLSISISTKDLDEDFFNSSISLNARLGISDGRSNLSSSYFGLKPQENIDISSLRIAEFKHKIVNRLYYGEDNSLMISFTDGTSICLSQHSIVPRLFLDYDGFWSISYDNRECVSRVMDSQGAFINAGDLNSECFLSIRMVEGNSGRYSYQVYKNSTPETILDEVGTPVDIDKENSLLYIVEDNVHNCITLVTMDGESFSLMITRIVPTGISVLTNKIKLAKGCTVSVEFRVNPSNAVFNYDISSSQCEISLDYVGEVTKSGYVTSPTNYTLTRVEQVYDNMGSKKEGQYCAYITDSGVNTDYDDLVALVLTIKDGTGQTIQYSSSAIELCYSSELFTSFEFRKKDNEKVLTDVVATINGNNILIITPYIFDASLLVPTFTTSGAKVYVDGELQESGISSHDFTEPIKYFVDKNEYIVTVKRSGLPIVVIDTPGGKSITSKEIWTDNTSITIYNSDGTVDYTDNAMQIRGRGNSTWSYPKKPYALKLNKKSEILGMPKHKRWVLLANWMDRTLIRNDVAFQIARQTGLDWTSRGKYVEVVLNGKHIGNYYLCEQIKVDKNRVNIAELKSTDIEGDAITGGYLVELDVYFDEVNKFRSSIRNLPYMIKDPDEETLQPVQLEYFQNYVNTLEEKLYSDDWLANREYTDYLDLDSFIDWWFVYELVKCGEPNQPKSSYMYKDRLGKLKAGPVWDFDYGTFLPGTQIKIMSALYYGRLFKDPDFVSLVKQRWIDCKPRFDTIASYIMELSASLEISNSMNLSMWPLSANTVGAFNGDSGLSYKDAIERLKSAYAEKLNFMDSLIMGWD